MADGFEPRRAAAFDDWFSKFHVDDLAFLVDVILRRRTGPPRCGSANGSAALGA
jgi:hypothetical protein